MYMKNPFEVFSPPEKLHEVQPPAGGRDGELGSTDFIRIPSSESQVPPDGT
jgi:hypothetical protein